MLPMVHDIIDRVQATLAQRGMTKRKLAKAAGLHRNTLLKAGKPNWSPSFDTLKALEPHILRAEDEAA